MSSAMCISGIASGLLIAAVFLTNAISGLPFGRFAPTLDVGFVVSGLMIAYLGWTALKQTR